MTCVPQFWNASYGCQTLYLLTGEQPTNTANRWINGPSFQLYLLTGQQTTNTATIMHVGARHYSPSLHRWLQRDPIDLLGGHPNMYTHVFGNPVMFVDPSGHQTEWKHGALLATVHGRWPGHTYLVLRCGPGKEGRYSIGFWAEEGASIGGTMEGCGGEWKSPDPYEVEDDPTDPVTYIDITSLIKPEKFQTLCKFAEMVADRYSKRDPFPGTYILGKTNCTTSVAHLLAVAGIEGLTCISPWGLETDVFGRKFPDATGRRKREVAFPDSDERPKRNRIIPADEPAPGPGRPGGNR